MILKYKGVVGDWFFAEGKNIRTVTVMTKGISRFDGKDDDAVLLDRIREETGIYNPIPVGDVLGHPFVVVVDIDGQEYAIATEAYILNDNGKTIERLI